MLITLLWIEIMTPLGALFLDFSGDSISYQNNDFHWTMFHHISQTNFVGLTVGSFLPL